jgi:hypothetical protein
MTSRLHQQPSTIPQYQRVVQGDFKEWDSQHFPIWSWMTDLAAMVRKTATTASEMEAPIGIIARRTSQWGGRVCAQHAQPHLVQAETAGVSMASLWSL